MEKIRENLRIFREKTISKYVNRELRRKITYGKQ